MAAGGLPGMPICWPPANNARRGGRQRFPSRSPYFGISVSMLLRSIHSVSVTSTLPSVIRWFEDEVHRPVIVAFSGAVLKVSAALRTSAFGT